MGANGAGNGACNGNKVLFVEVILVKIVVRVVVASDGW